MIRGVERRLIFLDDRDRKDLAVRLSRILPETGIVCLAWAFMPNHLHLVVRTGPTPLGRTMARVGTGYVKYFNHRHGRVGHLVQNRFKSRLVASDDDLLQLICYVHLNPLRAGIVGTLASLERFRWCGHGAMLGAAGQDFHAVSEALALYGDEPLQARIALIEAMQVRNEAWTQRDTDTLETLIEEVCGTHGVDPGLLRSGDRGQATTFARRTIARRAVTELGFTRAAVARAVGVSPSAVSRGLRRRARRR